MLLSLLDELKNQILLLAKRVANLERRPLFWATNPDLPNANGLLISSEPYGGIAILEAGDTYNPQDGTGTYQVLLSLKDGKVYAADGNVIIDDDGVTLDADTANYLRWVDTNQAIATIAAARAGSNYIVITGQGFGSGITQERGAVDIYANNGGSTKSIVFELIAKKDAEENPFAVLSASAGTLLGLYIGTTYTIPAAMLDVAGTGRFSGQVTSTLATGTKPFAITSTTMCDNLNADMVDGSHAADFATSGHTHSPATTWVNATFSTLTQITASVNDWDAGTSLKNRITSDGAYNIGGIVSTGAADGEVRTYHNVGSFALTFKNENGATTAAYRILTSTGADVAVAAGAVFRVVWDNTSSRWRQW